MLVQKTDASFSLNVDTTFLLSRSRSKSVPAIESKTALPAGRKQKSEKSSLSSFKFVGARTFSSVLVP